MNTNILIKPVITEKTMILASKGVFTFKVQAQANKNSIKKIVEKKFNVNVVDIKTTKVNSKKRVNRTTRRTTQKPDWKKAYLKLKKEQKIDLFTIEEKK